MENYLITLLFMVLFCIFSRIYFLENYILNLNTTWGWRENDTFLSQMYQLTSNNLLIAFSSVHFSHSVMSDSLWLHGPLSITNSWSPPKPMSIMSVMPSNHLILCCPLLLPSIFPSIRVFSNESALHIKQQQNVHPFRRWEGETFALFSVLWRNFCSGIMTTFHFWSQHCRHGAIMPTLEYCKSV